LHAAGFGRDSCNAVFGLRHVEASGTELAGNFFRWIFPGRAHNDEKIGWYGEKSRTRIHDLSSTEWPVSSEFAALPLGANSVSWRGQHAESGPGTFPQALRGLPTDSVDDLFWKRPKPIPRYSGSRFPWIITEGRARKSGGPYLENGERVEKAH